LLGGNPDFMAREFLKRKKSILTKLPVSNGLRPSQRAKRIVEDEHKEVVGIGGLHI